MEKLSLEEEIYTLIQGKVEGDYWDFKKEWHDDKADLLHDIICMANNLVNRDAYIIIGVTDSSSANGVEIVGVQNDNKRKNQQTMITFLRDKKFDGNSRPSVYVKTIILCEKEVDVIIIKNSRKTPFYLTAQFKDGRQAILPWHIYTRIGDTNTPKDKSADIDKVEYLWRKRFGIELTIKERLLDLLDNPKDWEGDFKNSKYVFHRNYPEFQIKIADYEDDVIERKKDNDIMKNIAAYCVDKDFNICEIEITYHSTVLFSCDGLYLDGYRILIPMPNTDTVYIGHMGELEKSLTYLYYDFSTINGKLFCALAKNDYIWYSEKWNKDSGAAFLQFDDDIDRKQFEEYVKDNLQDVLEKYNDAIEKKKKNGGIDEEYIRNGWSKGSEVKSRLLFEMYKHMEYKDILWYLPR